MFVFAPDHLEKGLGFSGLLCILMSNPEQLSVDVRVEPYCHPSRDRPASLGAHWQSCSGTFSITPSCVHAATLMLLADLCSASQVQLNMVPLERLSPGFQIIPPFPKLPSPLPFVHCLNLR